MPAGGAVPLGEVATVQPARGPTSTTEWTTGDLHLRRHPRPRPGRHVARAAGGAGDQFPPGYVVWAANTVSERASKKKIVVPVPFDIFLLLYQLWAEHEVMLSLPFSVGGLWLMWWLGFNLSVAVAVGFIALAASLRTGVVMLIYLNQACRRERPSGISRGGG